MRVYQPGSHLTQRTGERVDDWSWARTVRRVALLARLTRPYRARTVVAVASLLASIATALAPPYLAKLAIDDGIRGEDLTLLGWIVVAFLGTGLLNLVATAGQTYAIGWVGERVLTDLRARLFGHLQRLSLGYYERNRAGAVISRITNDVEALDRLVTEGVASLFQNTLTLFGSAIILFLLDWRLALATLAVFPLMSVATTLFRRYSSRAYRRVRERLATVTATLAEDIAGMRVVQSFTRERDNLQRFRGVNEDYRAVNHETVVLNALYFPFVEFLSAAATAVVLGLGGYLVFDGSMTVGTLFAFIGYLSNFFDPVQQLSQLYNTFLSAVAALDKIIDVMD
ncbi:MAG: ABC transporter ATP-binding protein, partial [Actinomycetota bacterium]|nr:ABC transporter ATP-binding protein [Actinomycetota bacterium]